MSNSFINKVDQAKHERAASSQDRTALAMTRALRYYRFEEQNTGKGIEPAQRLINLIKIPACAAQPDRSQISPEIVIDAYQQLTNHPDMSRDVNRGRILPQYMDACRQACTNPYSYDMLVDFPI